MAMAVIRDLHEMFIATVLEDHPRSSMSGKMAIVSSVVPPCRLVGSQDFEWI